MTRLIDADLLLDKYERWLNETPYINPTNIQFGQRTVLCDVYHDLKYTPTVDIIRRMDLGNDAVEVVRCKDCKLQQECKNAQYLGINGFCSYGERREP